MRICFYNPCQLFFKYSLSQFFAFTLGDVVLWSLGVLLWTHLVELTSGCPVWDKLKEGHFRAILHRLSYLRQWGGDIRTATPREELLCLTWDHGWDKTLPLDTFRLLAELLPDHTFIKGTDIYKLWLDVITSFLPPYFAQSQRFFFMWELNPRTQMSQGSSHTISEACYFFSFARALFLAYLRIEKDFITFFL